MIYSLLSDSEKSKDNPQDRKDLGELGIKKELWPVENGHYRLSLNTILNTKENGCNKDVLL